MAKELYSGGCPFLGHSVKLRRNPLEFLESAGDQGPVVSVRIGQQQAWLMAHPDAVRHVLREKADNWLKTKYAEKLKVVLGEGIATANGARWRASRAVAQRGLHPTRLTEMAPLLAPVVESWVQDLRLRQGQTLNMAEQCCGLAARMACTGIFGADSGDIAERTIAAVDVIQHTLAARMWLPVSIPAWLPTRGNRAFFGALREVEQIVAEVIALRRGQPPADDYLGLMLGNDDECTGRPWTAKQIRDEVVTMLVAGHETTGNAMAWALGELASRPEIAERVADEAMDLVGEARGDVESLRGLRYTRQVTQETLRLRPTAWWFARTAQVDDVVMGTKVRAGDVAIVAPWVTHRLTEFWDRPEDFDPERFSPEGQVGRHPFAYIPFGAGPRACPGGNLAYIELPMVLAAMTRAFHLALAPGARPAPEALVTLRPAGGMPMVLTARTVAPERAPVPEPARAVAL